MSIELKRSKLNNYCSVFSITMDQADCPRLKWISVIFVFQKNLATIYSKEIEFFIWGRGERKRDDPPENGKYIIGPEKAGANSI